MEYCHDFNRSVAKKSFCYLDTNVLPANANPNTGFEARMLVTRQNAAGDAPQDVSGIISLNRYSFFEELEDKMLVPRQLQSNLTLQNDDELIKKAADLQVAGRVVVNRFLLWLPKLIPKYSLSDNFVSSFLKEMKLSYLRSMYQMSAATRQPDSFYQISAIIDNVKHIFVDLQRTKTDNMDENPYLFDICKVTANSSYLTTCR